MANTPNKLDHSAITQKHPHPNLAESGGKTIIVKKVNKCDENCVEKLKKQLNFYVRGSVVKCIFFTNKLMILLLYKETYFNNNDLDHVMPSVAISLLQEFEDVFPEDIPSRLPHLKGIEHHIDLVPTAMLPNQLHIEVIPRRQMSFKCKLLSS